MGAFCLGVCGEAAVGAGARRSDLPERACPPGGPSGRGFPSAGGARWPAGGLEWGRPARQAPGGRLAGRRAPGRRLRRALARALS